MTPAVRRLLRELAAGGKVKGDTTTLEDLNVLAALQKNQDEDDRVRTVVVP